MKTGMTFDCPNCGPKARVESIEIGRDGDQVVNQLRCENCKQIWALGDTAKKHAAKVDEVEVEIEKPLKGFTTPTGRKKGGEK